MHTEFFTVWHTVNIVKLSIEDTVNRQLNNNIDRTFKINLMHLV